VYDVDTGVLVQEYTLTAPGTFVNDVIVTREAAYFTDSARAVYYRVPLGPGGQLADQSAVETIALTGEFQQVPSFNSNGIEASPNGKDLIIVNSSSGLLYRVDPLSGEATVIDLGGASVTMGDGLLLHGRTLYVVRNGINQIVVVKLAPDLSSGTVVGTLTQPNFDVPTTIAEFGNALYVVNARFTTPATPDTTYNFCAIVQG
jgi:sugar lactone lactonase YvrE